MKTLILLAATLALPLAFADHGGRSVGHCDTYETDVGILEITDGTADGTFYVERRADATYVYQETNGIWAPKAAGAYRGDDVLHSLQRGGGASPLVPDDAVRCADIGDFEPDARIGTGVL